MADPEILKRERAEDDVSVSPSFIANVHNELYVFYMGKGGLLNKQFWANRGGAAYQPPPLESATDQNHPKIDLNR